MRNLLMVLNLSMLVLLAGTPEGDYRWWLVVVGAVTGALLWRLAERERREERRAVQSAVWDDVLTVASSAQQQRQAQPADPDQGSR